MSNQAIFNKFSHTDVVAKFANENLVITNDCMDYVTTDNLHSTFKLWCKKNGYRNCSKLIFIKAMKNVKGPSRERQREPGKWKTQNAISMYRFVKLKEPQP
jgi:hypothetical protein